MFAVLSSKLGTSLLRTRTPDGESLILFGGKYSFSKRIDYLKPSVSLIIIYTMYIIFNYYE